MANLKLITTEKFGDLACNFYRNMNDDILLTREQIGTALEYQYPSNAIKNIHRKHHDRLESLCMRVRTGGYQSELTSKSEEQERVFYTERGIMEICRWSRQPKADKFMDWCWDIIEKYRSNQGFTNTIDTQMTKVLLETMVSMQKNISDIQDQLKQKTLPRKTYTRWSKRMMDKYSKLINYFNISFKELYHNLYIEFENRNPEIDLNELQRDYLYKYRIDDCYMLDAIEDDKGIRKLWEEMVDEILEKFDLFTESDILTTEGIHMRKKTIFDM